MFRVVRNGGEEEIKRHLNLLESMGKEWEYTSIWHHALYQSDLVKKNLIIN